MKIYAIIKSDTGELVTQKLIKKYWSGYGYNELHGWRAPKRIYENLKQAKAGFAHLPDELKSGLEIAEFDFVRTAIVGSTLRADQEKRRQEKENRYEAKIRKYLQTA